MKPYDSKTIEPKWQKIWEDTKLYQTPLKPGKDKYYCLVMLPYTSGDLHIGHWYNFGPGDTVARFNRMLGKKVLHPIGFDAFGLPAENAAIKRNMQPAEWTRQNIATMTKQLKKIGAIYDWDKSLSTADPQYYQWTQWMFLLLYKNGLAYRKKGWQNWCPKDQTVLANEQVVGEHSVCERCGTPVVKKELEQWFFKITDYAERLLKDLNELDWPQKVKTMQANWIGKSSGAEVNFKIIDTDQKLARSYVMGVGEIEKDFSKIGVKIVEKTEDGNYRVTIPKNRLKSFEELISKKIQPGFWNEYIADQVVFLFKNKKGEVQRYIWEEADETELLGLCNQYAKAEFPSIREMLEGNSWYASSLVDSIQVFTTRPDTLFGATYMVLAPEHPLVAKITTKDHETEVNKYIEKTARETEIDRLAADKTKTGVFTGAYAINPVNKEKIPIWIADYVLMGYGTGAIMAVPAHDERDWEFAKEFGLPIKKVIAGGELPYAGEGKVVNSGKYNGKDSRIVKEQIVQDLAKTKAGQTKVNFKLRDWLISRQRYWGAPIPIIYCKSCGTVPVPEKDLPVVLPENVKFRPTGQSPLLDIPEFVNVDCPQCGQPAQRETDTMDTFVDSSWYFLRYPDPKFKPGPYNPGLIKDWLPIDHYIGGIEHAILHLLYARFFTKVLADHAKLGFSEPFIRLSNQGLILGADGQKMSKSKGNVVNPDDWVGSYGADTFRMYLMFMGPYEQGGPFDSQGISGTRRFLDRVWNLVREYLRESKRPIAAENPGQAETRMAAVINKTIAKVSRDLEQLSFNTAIAALMELSNELYIVKEELAFGASPEIWRQNLATFILLLAPFAPHITEELWRELGNQDSVHIQAWPVWDEKLLVEDSVIIVVQVNGKVRSQLTLAANTAEPAMVKFAKADAKIKAHLKGKKIIKTVTVPGKLVSFVVSPR